MKIPSSFLGSSFAKSLLLLALGLLATLPAQATLLFSGVDLGAAGRTSQWAAFALSGGITDTDTTSQVPNPSVTGNIGAAGTGGVTLSGSATIAGDAYVKTGSVLRKSGAATVAGTVIQSAPNDTFLNTVVANANSAAAQANALANNSAGITYGGWNSLTTVNQNTSLSLTDTTPGAHVVLHLTDFVLTGGATFTLTGTASTTYVINVSNSFSLLGGKVLLAGGLTPENVLFNIVGSGADVSLTSAAQFNGFILATGRTVNLSGVSALNGTVIANKVNISGGSKVTQPTYTSP
jgi:hypothetical protein